MRYGIATLMLIGCLAGAAGPARAHHAFSATFDSKKPIKMTGTVTKIEWQNPHAWFYMDVKEPDGKATNWGMELGSPNLLVRSGWSRNSLKIGDAVSIEGFQARDGTPTGNAQVVILTATGQRLFAASSAPPAKR